jgi:predicted O-methyltransferase YrrM
MLIKRLAARTSGLERVTNALRQLYGRVGDLYTFATELRGQIDRHVNSVAQIQRQIDEQSERVAQIQSQVRQQSTSVVELGRTLNIIRQELLLVYERPHPASSSNGNAQPLDPPILRDFVEASRINEVYPTDLFPELEKVSIAVGAINEESSHTNQVDLLYVAAMAKAREAVNIFEIGTYQGRTTYHLAMASPNARVTTLNLPPEKDPSVAAFLGIMYKGSDKEKQITQLYADSREFDPTPYTGQMDYIFVDGDHSYELVKNDTEKALVMLKRGGMVVWHDYAAKSPGVVRYIKEFSQSRSVFRLKHTCLIVYIDGVDAMAFQPPARRPSWVS